MESARIRAESASVCGEHFFAEYTAKKVPHRYNAMKMDKKSLDNVTNIQENQTKSNLTKLYVFQQQLFLSPSGRKASQPWHLQFQEWL